MGWGGPTVCTALICPSAASGPGPPALLEVGPAHCPGPEMAACILMGHGTQNSTPCLPWQSWPAPLCRVGRWGVSWGVKGCSPGTGAASAEPVGVGWICQGLAPPLWVLASGCTALGQESSPLILPACASPAPQSASGLLTGGLALR